MHIPQYYFVCTMKLIIEVLVHAYHERLNFHTFTPRDTKSVAPIRRKNANKSGNVSNTGLSNPPILEIIDLEMNKSH